MSWSEKFRAWGERQPTVGESFRRIREAFQAPEVRQEALRDEIAETLLTSNPDWDRMWAIEMANEVLTVLRAHAPLYIERGR